MISALDYQIQVEGLILQAWVGIHPHEQRPQPVVIDFRIDIQGPLGEDHDSIEQALDYEELINRIQKFLLEKKFKLLETLTHSIGELIMEDPRVQGIEINAGKPGILYSKRISIKISRGRSRSV